MEYNISVVIPTYNRERYIKKSIESVLCQEGRGIDFEIREVIVVDDGSSDNTEEVLGSISDGLVLLYRMSVNSGAAAARNVGVEIADADWIAFQDSDDIWHTDKLIKQVNYLKMNPDVKMVSHPIREIFEDGSEVSTVIPDDSDLIGQLAEKNYYGTPTMLVRKDCFIESGGFDIRLSALEDWEYALRFAEKYRIGMVPEVLIDSQMTADGVSSDASNYYESRCRMIAWNKDILTEHGCFETAVRALLVHAERNGVLHQVGKMLELNLMS